jgi:branched-chain amino acid aminotransferase
MKGGYFLFNGQFYKEKEPVFHLADLSRRAEGFSEFFRAEHNEVLFLESISNHLWATAESTGLDLEGIFDLEGRVLRKDVSRLLNKNKLYLSAKIEIQIYPSNGKINVILSAEEIERGYYPFKEPGLLLLFYRDHLKGTNADSVYATADIFIRTAAQRAASALNRPNMILLNREECACESIGGSFAYLDQKQVIFPSDGAGGYRCAIKEQVIKSAKEAGFKPVEKEKLSMDDLLHAEELFLYDSVNGIQKVLGLEDRRYFSPKTQLIAGKLSALAKKDREKRE